jgi:hypothetical protein
VNILRAVPRAVLRLAPGAFVLIATPVIAVAQGTRLGPIILELPSGPRTLALGNTGVAGRDDDVIFFNPAQVAVANGFSVSGERYSETAGSGALSAVTRFNGSGGIAIGMRLANYQLPFGTLPAARALPLDRGSSSNMSAEASVAYAQPFKGTRIGVALKYAEDVTSSLRLDAPLVDVGLSRNFFGSTFGLAVQNIGRDIHDAGFANVNLGNVDLPVLTTLGASRAQIAGPFDLYGTAAIGMLRDERFEASGGLEVGYSWLSGYSVALRAGARRREVGIEPFTAGAGLTMDRLSIDYAVEALSNSHLGQRVGLRIR